MSFKELKDELPKLITRLKVTEEFKTNPAFSSYIRDIINLIDNLNVSEDVEVNISENEVGLYLNYNISGESGKISISSTNFKTISCKSLLSKNLGFSPKLGRDLRMKTATDLIAKLDDSNKIEVHNNIVTISDLNYMSKTIDILVIYTTMKYSSYGILYEKERKIYQPNSEFKPYDLFTGKDMFSFIDINGNLNQSENYSELIKYSRNTIDTARVLYLNNIDSTKYCGVVELDKEHSLRYLIPIMPIKSLITSVSRTDIRELSKEEIDELIERETNEKIKIGLKEFATSRIGYKYSKEEDPYYYFSADQRYTR